MKPVMMFVTSWCPYCKSAVHMIHELRSAHPEYQDIAIDILDEEECPEFSDRFDYYYVPTLYVGGKKMHEGIPTLEKLDAVLR